MVPQRRGYDWFPSWVLLTFLLWAACGQAAPAVQYTLTDLGVDTFPFALDATGTVVGERQAPPYEFVAAILTPPPGQILGTLPGPGVGVSAASGVAGETVVGQSTLGDPTINPSNRAFTWTAKGGLRDLGTLGPLGDVGFFSAANAINGAGVIVGWSTSIDRRGLHPVVWTGMAITDLGTLGGLSGRAVAINGEGDIVGSSQTASGMTHATLWPITGGIVDLDALGCMGCVVAAMNSQRDVVGTVGDHPILWSSQTGLQFLPLLPGGTTGQAADMTDAGVIVGASVSADGRVRTAVRWDNGKPTGLQTLVTNGAGWTLERAAAINEAGLIVGTGTLNGRSHGWLLTPVAPPSLPPPALPGPILAGSFQADFDGDGTTDILWRHATTGQVYIWLMRGRTVHQSGSPGTVADLNWRIEGTGDFDGDGQADILWRHATTGEVYLWLMQGVGLRASGSPGTVADPNWEILGIGDFDGDGHADILWRHATTGELYLWFMHGLTLRSHGSAGQVGDLRWQIERGSIAAAQAGR